MKLAVQKMPGRRPFPPQESAFTARFWQALGEGELLATRCRECARLTFPPKPLCPHCWCREVEWAPLSGRGVIYSHTTVHAAPALFAQEAPYRLCIVDLDEGLRLAARLVDAGSGVGIGARVEFVVLRYEDGPLFAARPLDAR